MDLTGKTVKYKRDYVEMFASGCPSDELAAWYRQMYDSRFVVVYDDGGPAVAVKSDQVYALRRQDLEVAE